MWLVKNPNKEGGLLCRTQEAIKVAVSVFDQTGEPYEILETNVCEIADPMEQ